MAPPGLAVGLDAPALRHRLRLGQAVGIEGLQGLHALFRERDEGDAPVRAEGEFLYAGGAVEAAAVGQRPVVVEHVVVALEINVAAVDGEAVLRLVHDAPAVGPGAVDGGCGRISHVLGHAARRVGQVVEAVALVEPGALLIADHHLLPAAVGPVRLHRLRAEAGRVAPAGDLLPPVRERHHVVAQAAVPAALVAPHEPGGTVIVDEDGRVDEGEAPGQRAADGIHIGPLRVVRHGDGQGVAARGRLRQADIPVPFAVALDELGSPGAVALEGPGEGSRGHLCAEVGPVDHVLGAVQQPVLHQEISSVVLVVIDEEIDLVPVDIGRRIGGE